MRSLEFDFFLVERIFLNSTEFEERHNCHVYAHVSKWQLEAVRLEPVSITVLFYPHNDDHLPERETHADDIVWDNLECTNK